ENLTAFREALEIEIGGGTCGNAAEVERVAGEESTLGDGAAVGSAPQPEGRQARRLGRRQWVERVRRRKLEIDRERSRLTAREQERSQDVPKHTCAPCLRSYHNQCYDRRSCRWIPSACPRFLAATSCCAASPVAAWARSFWPRSARSRAWKSSAS